MSEHKVEQEVNPLLSGDKLDTLKYSRDQLKQALADAAQAGEPKHRVTTNAINPPQVTKACRWGALLDDERVVTFQCGQDKPAISVSLTNHLTLGRLDTRTGEQPDVDLSLYDAFENGVSRKHVRLYLEDGMLKVMDLNSTNMTFLNGTRLPAHQSRILRSGDELQLGRLVLHVIWS
jgi:hypothetical protein